ncbi:hypothetical protein TNCV_4651851 [Trichonephila clavipes]|nr:hypothetical protein TNCV_4651851 [Trichonephila clavipes]
MASIQKKAHRVLWFPEMNSPLINTERKFRCCYERPDAKSIKRWNSYAAEQFHSDVSLEVVDQREQNNSKKWQWTTERDVSARRSTTYPHGAGNDHTASSRQMVARGSTATGALMST